MLPLRAVLFDLWGTLLIDDPERAEQRRLLRVRMTLEALAGLGFTYYDGDWVEQAFRAAAEDHGRVHAEQRDISAGARTALYLRHLDESLPERLDERGWSLLDDAILTPALTVPPLAADGAGNLLADVKSLKLRTGLVSNAGVTPGAVLREILQKHDLLPLLDVAIFSDEVELAKPAPAIFEEALDDLEVEAHEAAFLGDQPLLDVLGARSVGLWSVQVGELAEDAIEPHARISRLDELLPTLRALGLLP